MIKCLKEDPKTQKSAARRIGIRQQILENSKFQVTSSKTNNPGCAHSRTGFIMTLGDIPILWASKMQTETALSVMAAISPYHLRQCERSSL
jgi:hypothetical protein